MRRRLAPLLPAVAVGVLAFLWLGRLNPPVFPINDDAIRDQLLVRDCTDLGFCHLLGALSSFGDLYHGAVWIHLLTAVRLLGGDLAAQRIVVLACLALSVSTLFIVVWQWLRPSFALPAAVLLIGALSLDMPATLLINPSIAVFPDLLTTAGLLCYGLSRQRRFLLLSAFSLGVAVSMHTASVALLAPFLIIVAAARPRAWGDLILAAAIAGFTFAIPSSATLRANVLALAAHGLLLPMLAAGLAVTGVSVALGSRFRSYTWNARACVIGAIVILPFTLILSWLVIAQGHYFSVIYLHPILAPGAVAVAAIATQLFERLARWLPPLRWIPTVAAGAVVAVAALTALRPVSLSPGREVWSIGEAAVIAHQVAARGWSYEDLLFHLQGSACRELLAGMAALAPAPAPRTVPDHGRRQLQVVKAPRDAFVAHGDLVALGSDWARLREIDSWLQPLSLKACRVPITPGGVPLCAAVTAAMSDARLPERFLFLNRSFPLVESLDRQARPYIATYEIPLAPTAGERRDLAVADNHASPCGWRITRVDGVRVEGTLPASRVRLHAANAGAGLVVFEKPFGTPGCPSGDIDSRYPPCVLETSPDDPLQDLVGRS